MRLAGILPTVESNFDKLNPVINQILNQTLKCDLIIVFQGNEEQYEELKIKGKKLKILIVYCKKKSLARSKNYIIKSVAKDYDYFFIYEDDVEYTNTYNEEMLQELNRVGGAMISCVEKIKPTLKKKVRNVFFQISHLPPLNDKRQKMALSNKMQTIKTPYLSGGLTLISGKVFKDYLYNGNYIKYSLGEDMDFSFRVSTRYKTVLTNKIRCVHNSVANNKFNIEKALIEKLYAWSYFIQNNIKEEIIFQKRILICFFFTEVLLQCLLKQNIGIMKNWLFSLKCIKKKDYSRSEFIDESETAF